MNMMQNNFNDFVKILVLKKEGNLLVININLLLAVSMPVLLLPVLALQRKIVV